MQLTFGSNIPWNDEYLAEQFGLIENMDTIKFDEAQDQGWAFGYFRGRFAKARVKLEEAQHIRIALDSFDRNQNYAGYRALFFGRLCACTVIRAQPLQVL